MVSGDFSIRRAQVQATGAAEAAQAFHAAVAQPQLALVVFFCSAQYELKALGAEMRRLFGEVPVVGCTTSGAMGPEGWQAHSISGASFASSHFAAAACRLGDLQGFTTAQGQAAVQLALQTLERKAPGAHADNSFAFMLIDGVSVREELVTRSLQAALGHIPLVGGSASGTQTAGPTWVYADGAFQADSAALALVSTPLPFRPVMTHHFKPTEQRLVVTAADPARRIVHEIDGLPAAQAYAALLGVAPSQLNPARFAASPLAVMIGGTSYVRSIRQALPDGSLVFYCAIEEGLVLRITHSTDLVANLAQTLASLHADIGPLQLVLGGDCILRRVEIEQRGLERSVSELMQRYRVCAFNTFGEQYRGVHMNQTFAAIAIGSARQAGHA